MAAYQNLNVFEGVVIVGDHEMGYTISEIKTKFGFSRSTISRLYLDDYKTLRKMSSVRHQCDPRKALDDPAPRRLARIVTTYRNVPLPQITGQFDVGAGSTISDPTVQGSLCSTRFQNQRPTRVLLFNPRHKTSPSLDCATADGRLRVWRKPHEVMDSACQ